MSSRGGGVDTRYAGDVLVVLHVYDGRVRFGILCSLRRARREAAPLD